MTLTSRISLAGALLGGLVLMTAGCGGSGSNAAATTPATTTSAPTTTASMTTNSTGGGLGNLVTPANCQKLYDLSSQFAAAFAGTNENIEDQAAVFRQFADQTPEEIRPDFQTIAEAYAKIAEALKGVDLTSGKTPSPTVMAKLAALSGQLDQAKLAQAEAHISNWATENCTTTH
jgi:hypothetical protein